MQREREMLLATTANQVFKESKIVVTVKSKRA